jgi:hypothetical protein
MGDSKRIEKKRNSAAGRSILPRKSAHVPAQALGYLIQPIRLLQLLLDAPADSFVTLEVFEDVGLETRNGQKIASQVKTGLVKNPLSDRSLEFWKTLANWCDAIERNELDPERTIFEIYVAKQRKGKIATLFTEAKSLEETRRALESAQKCFPKKHSGKRAERTPTEADCYADRVLSFNQSALTKLIQNFRITTATRNPLADLRPAVAAKWIRPESVDLVIQHAHGWVKEKLDTLLLAKKPASIGANDFNHEILSFLPRCDFRTMVTSMAGLPSAEEIAAEKVRTYVRQLEIIRLDDETTLHSINEYLRASVTRTRLAEEGIVHGDSFTDYEEALTTFWRNKKRQNALTHTQRTPEDMGQLLLSDCCLHQQKLQGLEMPAYFTPGSYHALADAETIGWHPEYHVRLKGAAS